MCFNVLPWGHCFFMVDYRYWVQIFAQRLIILCGVVDVDWHLRGTYWFHHESRWCNLMYFLRYEDDVGSRRCVKYQHIFIILHKVTIVRISNLIVGVHVCVQFRVYVRQCWTRSYVTHFVILHARARTHKWWNAGISNFRGSKYWRCFPDGYDTM